jgi:hypothetical protein
MDWRNFVGYIAWHNVCVGVLMNVPYNNGKVEIGKYYQKPKYIEQDADMILIQSCLIGDNKAAKIQYWGNIAYKWLLAIAIILGIIYG